MTPDPYIPNRSDKNIQEADIKLCALANAFDNAARKRSNSIWPKQKRVAAVYRDLACAAREIGEKIDQRDVSLSNNKLVAMHTVFLHAALATSLPAEERDFGVRMNEIGALLTDQFFKMRDARFDAPPSAPPKPIF